MSTKTLFYAEEAILLAIEFKNTPRYNMFIPNDQSIFQSSLMSPQSYQAIVQAHGLIQVSTNLPVGSSVTVIVATPETPEDYSELTQQSLSAFSFWDNELDDEDWNHA